MNSEIRDAVERVIKKHGGLNKAAREIGMQPAHLCRIRRGQITNLSPRTLARFGLRRKVTILKA